MSLRTLLIWSIIAGFLGGGAVFVRNQMTQASENTKAEWAGLDFDPASIVSIEFGAADQGVRIERHPDRIDEWTGTWSSDEGDNTWGMNPNRIRGALRTLSTTPVRLSVEQLTEIKGGLVLTSRDGSILSLSLGSDRSGGRAPLRLEQRDESGAIERVLHGWVESGIADAFRFDNTLSWRDQKLMSIPVSSVDRVSIEAGDFATSLGLSNGRWHIVSPIRIDADRGRVEQLIGTLLGLNAKRFVDQPIDDATTGLSSPIATISLHSNSETYALAVGQRADIGGDTLYARFSSGGTDTLIHIPLEALTQLTAVPDAYVSTTAGSFAITDVRDVRIFNKENLPKFNPIRDGTTWSVDGVRTDTLNENAINRLLSLLAQTPADAVRVLPPEQTLPKTIAGLEILDLHDISIAPYTAAIEQSDQGIRLLIMRALDSGHHVVWAYVGEEAQATATWLTLTAGRSGS